MKFEIKAYNLQELGQRQNQEDSLYPALGQSTNDDRLFILCDGMGGHEKGEVASATVCETMSKSLLSMWNPTQPLTDDMFQKTLDAAYDALNAKDNGEERKMGTTMTFVCLHADGVSVAHIGDSRIYQLRPAKDGNQAQIVFRTQDHSLVNDLVRVGEITEEEAKHHPQKNVITRAMQPCQERRAKADITHLTDIQPGDYFYMCSDGMLEEATDENILNIITMPDKTDEEKFEMLRKVTEENKDNHTAHLIHINKVEGAVVIAAIAVAASTYFLTTGNGEEGEQPADSAKAARQEISYKTFTANGISFDMAKVEAGTFMMGATPEMKDPYANEKPAHQVTLTNNYYLGKTEVTQALWKAVMGSNPSEFKGDNKPVERVEWDDCQTFISKLNAATGKHFRLPTEAEWEFAARGGNNSKHYQYSGSDNIDDVAWYDDSSEEGTHDVATKQPNELGIYDMSGNVWEWCNDWYGDYSSSSQTNPTGPISGSYRVRRGGVWFNFARICRSSSRNGFAPGFGYYDLGLRLALSE